MTKKMWNRTFKGAVDWVTIDEKGHRHSDFVVKDLNVTTGEFQDALIYSPANNSIQEIAPIHWPERTDPPPSEPYCGFMNEKLICKIQKLPKEEIIAIGVGTFTIIVGAAAFLIYRRRKATYFNAEEWIINWDDLLIHSRGSRMSTFIKDEEFTTVTTGNIMKATLKGDVLEISNLGSKKHNEQKYFHNDIKQICHLIHSNLNRFHGITFHDDSIYALWNYCSRGNLRDILENESFQLDWTIRGLFIKEMIEGMVYIHDSELNCHGFLTSYSCKINSRFSLQITDFGFKSLRKEKVVKRDPDVIFWMAPEILRSDVSLTGTKKSDVYSFGIILYEIITRLKPFENELQKFSLIDILEMLQSPKEVPFRPVLPEVVDCQNYLKEGLAVCLQENPESRPTFKSILINFDKHNRKKVNFVDHLISRLEQYTNNLEEIVSERTSALLEEKRKTEILLLELLPRFVMEQLTAGGTVEPEMFESVSLYFSDIVSFTALSARSTALQVIDLLNDLYTLFDGIIEKYDAYKVETIGDAYLVASGLPIRNNKNHGPIISRMGLEILQGIRDFKIRHKPNESLRIRIGLHTGNCVAGVVGVKMPRYCLFGDTVQKVQLMESSGAPMKVQVSEPLYHLLLSFDSFQLEERPDYPAKQKWDVKTFWLLEE